MVKIIFQYATIMLLLAVTETACKDSTEENKPHWFPLEAKWTLTRGRVIDITIEKEIVVEGKRCRVVSGENGEDIVYEENGRVYYYFNNQFRKIYDFNVKIGDVVDFEFKTTDAAEFIEGVTSLNTTIVLPFRIESVTTKTIDAVKLREISALYFDPLSNFEYRHVYLEKVGVEPEFNTFIFLDGILPVCPERTTVPGSTQFHSYQDYEIEYFPRWWSVRLTLKPQADANYLATEDPQIKALVLKYGVEFRQDWQGIIPIPIPELLMFYTLKGKGGRKIVIRDFLSTGKFEDEVYDYGIAFLN